MVKLAANLTMLFTEYPALERFDRAAQAGFTAVEFLFPYEFPVAEVAAAVQRSGTELVLMNLPAGDWSAGERGLAAQPARIEEFASGLKKAVDYAAVLRPPRINCLAGKSAGDATAIAALDENIHLAAGALEQIGVQLTVEPVNGIDVPGFALPTTQSVLDLIARVDHPNVGLQYDIYHAMKVGEDPFSFLAEHGSEVSHIQIADVPGRHQPGTGEVDFARLFEIIDASGYSGFVSLEYIPEGPTEDGFGYLRELGFLA